MNTITKVHEFYIPNELWKQIKEPEKKNTQKEE